MRAEEVELTLALLRDKQALPDTAFCAQVRSIRLEVVDGYQPAIAWYDDYHTVSLM